MVELLVTAKMSLTDCQIAISKQWADVHAEVATIPSPQLDEHDEIILTPAGRLDKVADDRYDGWTDEVDRNLDYVC